MTYALAFSFEGSPSRTRLKHPLDAYCMLPQLFDRLLAAERANLPEPQLVEARSHGLLIQCALQGEDSRERWSIEGLGRLLDAMGL